MLIRRILFSLLIAGSFVLTARASLDPVQEAAARQAELKQQFESFRSKLAVLAGRLEGGSEKDREKARALRAALKLVGERGTEGKFDALIRALKTREAAGSADILSQVLRDNADLRADLRQLIDLISAGGRDQELKQERESLGKVLERVKEVRSRQSRLQALTDLARTSPAELRKSQEKLTEQTREIPKSPEAGAIRRELEEAVSAQRRAEGSLARGDRGAASDEQAGAVGRLDAAVRRLESMLEQLRREEMERVLTNLLRRCELMLAAEIAIRDGTVVLDRQIELAPLKKPTLALAHQANGLSDKQDRNLREADAALKVLEAEGSAVAFTEVFQQVRQDMRTVKERLGRADAGKVTQTIENDLIDTLGEMVRALKKSHAEVSTGASPPPPSPPTDPTARPTLLDKLAELKMLHAMQARVNARTALYSLQYPGEQAPEPESAGSAQERETRALVQSELAELAGRQLRIGQVARNLGRGR